MNVQAPLPVLNLQHEYYSPIVVWSAITVERDSHVDQRERVHPGIVAFEALPQLLTMHAYTRDKISQSH